MRSAITVAALLAALVGCEDAGPSACMPPPPDPYTQLALELAAAADPATVVSVSVTLVEVPFDFGRFTTATGPESDALIAERMAALAPSQDAIARELAAVGGREVARQWGVNSMLVEVRAGIVADMRCWPNVLGVYIEDHWWDVVPPPWDSTTVGTLECPVIGGACPEHCLEVRGWRIDEARDCLEPPTLLTCSRERSGTGDAQCRVDAAGRLYMFGMVHPTEPGYRGWFACTPAQQESFFSGHSTVCAP